MLAAAAALGLVDTAAVVVPAVIVGSSPAILVVEAEDAVLKLKVGASEVLGKAKGVVVSVLPGRGEDGKAEGEAPPSDESLQPYDPSPIGTQVSVLGQ